MTSNKMKQMLLNGQKGKEKNRKKKMEEKT